MGRVLAVAVVSLLFLGCSDDTTTRFDLGVRDVRVGDGARELGVSELGPTGDGARRDGSTPGARELSMRLSGAQVVPRVQTTGSAAATITINAAKTEIAVSLTVSNLGNLAGADLALGEVGKEGPVLFQLVNQSFVNPLTVTLHASDLKAQPSLGVSTFAQAADAIAGGMAYLMVRTQQYAKGELRGQTGVVTLQSQLTPDQEVPPVTTSSARAAATVVVAADQKSVDVTLTPKDLVGASGAFLQLGAVGQNGPVIFKITTQPFTSEVKATLKAADFTPQPGQGLNDFPEAIDAILAGQTYVNVNTSVNANGELRGPVGRVVLAANLSGQAVLPPVTTLPNANANAQINIPNSRQQIRITLTFGGLDGITGASIHAADATKNGPVIFNLTSASFESPFDVVLLPKDLTPQAGAGVATFQDAIQEMLTGGAYLVITTTDHGEGAVRGQIGGQ